MRILISGYYGFGNVGDEAILAALVAHLHERHPEAQVCVLSSQPEATARALGVEAAQRWSWPVIWRELRRADLLIQGGGGLLQDTTSAVSPLYYLGLLRLSRLAGTPYAIFAQGLGPLQRPILRRLARANLSRAASITLRDEASAAFLRDELRVTYDPLVAPDPALCLPPASLEAAEDALCAAGLGSDAPRIGIVLREWPGVARVEHAVSEFIARAAEEWGARCLLIPFQREADLAQCVRLSSGPRASVWDRPASPVELVALMARLDMVIAMRLHALIFAVAQAVPMVGISYDPKVAAFCEQAGQPCLEFAEVTAAGLWHWAAEAFDPHCLRTEMLAMAAEGLSARAEEHFAALDRVIAGLSGGGLYPATPSARCKPAPYSQKADRHRGSH